MENLIWFDYENDKAIALTPAGADIEVHAAGEEVRQMHVVWSGDDVVFGYDNNAPFVYAHFSAKAYLFKPADHATRKAEAERIRVVDAVRDAWMRSPGEYDDVFEFLYDIGALNKGFGK